MNLRKNWKGTDEQICWDRALVLLKKKKRICRAAVSQRLRNSVLHDQSTDLV